MQAVSYNRAASMAGSAASSQASCSQRAFGVQAADSFRSHQPSFGAAKGAAPRFGLNKLAVGCAGGLAGAILPLIFLHCWGCFFMLPGAMLGAYLASKFSGGQE